MSLRAKGTQLGTWKAVRKGPEGWVKEEGQADGTARARAGAVRTEGNGSDQRRRPEQLEAEPKNGNRGPSGLGNDGPKKPCQQKNEGNVSKGSTASERARRQGGKRRKDSSPKAAKAPQDWPGAARAEKRVGPQNHKTKNPEAKRGPAQRP